MGIPAFLIVCVGFYAVPTVQSNLLPSCDGVTIQNGTSGVISTPLFPNIYLPNMDCVWNVETPENTVIAVRFNTSFRMTSSEQCKDEYLQVFDGPTTSSTQFQQKYCESWAPRSFVTTGNALTVRFVSSSAIDSKAIGFLLAWTAEEKCESNEFTCWDGICLPESAKCNKSIDCPNDIADEVSCANSDGTQCGVSEIEPEFQWHTRIIGGCEAVKGSWPWQGNLIVVSNDDLYFQCGAVLLTPYWVLTAAHCISPGLFTLLKFGDYDLMVPDSDAEQTVVARRIFVHPKYNWTDEIGFIYGYDISLIYLETPVTFTKWVKPICLPDREVVEGEDVVLTGWGRTKTGGSISRILRQVVAPVVSREKCGELSQIPNLSDSIICSGLPFGGASTCQGDSGGPLMAFQNGSWVVAGLTSFGVVCGEWHIPGSYANVHNLLPYIHDVMENGMKDPVLVKTMIQGLTSGNISSPNFGNGNYPGGIYQQWHIVVNESKVIEIRFHKTFQIHQYYYGNRCGGDYLNIYDGPSTESPRYGDKRLCGYSRPRDMESQSNEVVVEFVSDHNFEHAGFSISWKAVDRCASDEYRCWNQSCIKGSAKCDGVQDCPSNIDEFECARGTVGTSECGKTEIAPEFTFSPYIIGGSNAKQGSWPWQVAIYVGFDGEFLFYGSGTLISEFWVLTIGTLFPPGSEYRVVVGGYNKSMNSDSEQDITIDVEMAFRHPGYTGIDQINNIGYLKLATPVDFTSKWYKPVCLPSIDTMYPPPGATCVVTGWGTTGESTELTRPDILQQLHVTILNDTKCYSSGADPNLICTGSSDRDVGLCSGDAGAPLVCQSDGRWVQYGIASSLVSTCGSRVLYQRVSLHVEDILDVTNITLPAHVKDTTTMTTPTGSNGTTPGIKTSSPGTSSATTHQTGTLVSTASHPRIPTTGMKASSPDTTSTVFPPQTDRSTVVSTASEPGVTTTGMATISLGNSSISLTVQTSSTESKPGIVTTAPSTTSNAKQFFPRYVTTVLLLLIAMNFQRKVEF